MMDMIGKDQELLVLASVLDMNVHDGHFPIVSSTKMTGKLFICHMRTSGPHFAQRPARLRDDRSPASSHTG